MEEEKPEPVVPVVQEDKAPTEKNAKEDDTKQEAVAVASANNNGAGPAEETEVTDEPEVTVVVAAIEEVVPKMTSATDESKFMEELNKLKAQISKESDKALAEAHSELAKLSSLNMDDIDEMTPTQLKVRLVQMAKEMEDRTRWEAVRMQEFLVMKEKEVEDKYVHTILV